MKKSLVGLLALSMATLVFAGQGTDPSDYNDRFAPAYEIPNLNDMNASASFGRTVYNNTWKYLGANSGRVGEDGKPFIGNKLSCNNCHAPDGIKPDASPMVVVALKYSGSFVKYSSRSNEVRDLPIRINGCMNRSLFGQSLPLDSAEMIGMVDYFTYLATNKGVRSFILHSLN